MRLFTRFGGTLLELISGTGSFIFDGTEVSVFSSTFEEMDELLVLVFLFLRMTVELFAGIKVLKDFDAKILDGISTKISTTEFSDLMRGKN